MQCSAAILWILLLCLLPAGGAWAAPVSAAIKTDHFGYRTSDSKLAFFTTDPGAVVQVLRAADGSVAYAVPSGGIKDMGTDASSPLISGDHVWWVDFSALTAPGTYTVYSPALNGQSYSFQVSDAIYQAPLAAALKSLYYARCGTPKAAAFGGVWNDTACHAADLALTCVCAVSDDYPALDADYGALDLSGGWHDAGDYEKKIGFGSSCGTQESGDSGDALWYLLSAYELNPGLFSGLALNLPETGNGLPDILNQAKWELDWYLKMQRADYHVLEGVHCQSLSTLLSPPSADATGRGYNPPSFESEACFTASTAHAARIFASLPGQAAYAAILKSAALSTWGTWVVNSPNVDPQAPSYLPYLQFKLWAASEVFRLDPTQSAAQAFIDSQSSWASYASSPAYTNYAMINYIQSPGATASTVAAMKAALASLVNTYFTGNDLYNSGMLYYQYSWGSSQFKADTGMLLAWAAALGFTGSQSAAQCLAHAEDFLHYFHGANPLNMVYLTNTDAIGGKHCVWQVFNSWFGRYQTAASLANFIGKPASVADPLYPYTPQDDEASTYGPPPGYVPDGPSFQYFTLGGTDVPPDLPGPAAAPYAKAYRDYNKSATSASQPWIVNEAGIQDTASYVMLAALFAGSAVASPTPTPSSPAPPQATATCSATPRTSITPTPSFTALASRGSLEILAMQPWPNPNPTSLAVKLGAAADRVELSIYTSGLTQVSRAVSGPYPAGWVQVPIPADWQGAPNGLYYARAMAYSHSTAFRSIKPAKLFRLR